jgi:hypothetical protein
VDIDAQLTTGAPDAERDGPRPPRASRGS